MSPRARKLEAKARERRRRRAEQRAAWEADTELRRREWEAQQASYRVGAGEPAMSQWLREVLERREQQAA